MFFFLASCSISVFSQTTLKLIKPTQDDVQ